MGNNNSTAQNNKGGGNHSPTNNNYNNDNDDASSLGAHSSFSQGGASSSHHSTYEHGPVTQMVPIPGAQSSHLNSLGGGGGRGQQGGGEALEPALVPVAITCEWRRSFLRLFLSLVRFSRRRFPSSRKSLVTGGSGFYPSGRASLLSLLARRARARGVTLTLVRFTHPNACIFVLTVVPFSFFSLSLFLSICPSRNIQGRKAVRSSKSKAPLTGGKRGRSFIGPGIESFR